ncbi:Nitrite transporter [Nitrospina gracilis 3/211]|uniref:Nitrite transporter n=1 Tax=Nitrospina gracilis (strain 3/211) TaxID=1266370 RepID=M1YH28_NITG3|nr:MULTISPECIES: formate/nitrite transporter family protein [Nitrospina]MCF8722789.1 nitrite transporter NirC [Nitrospina sp. Nb-3]CCQ89743.1 Nitrite transporter [Nitrospina gracilis 3/211]
MFDTDIDNLSNQAEKKIAYLKRSPGGYFLLSALAGIYLGFGIVLIFSIGGPIAAGGGGAYLKLIMGASFGIALSLVIFAGSELFTGNNMVFAVGRLSRRIGIRPILYLFGLCFIGNLCGSVFLAWLVTEGGSLPASSQELIVKVAGMKMNLSAKEAFLRGILCNWLVCLAVWIALRTKNESARLIMIFWCLFAFIASAYEHSIANQTLLSLAMFLPHGAEVSLGGFIHNQIWVTLGNMVGGGLLVGMVYWLANSQPETQAESEPALIQETLQEESA